MKKDVGAVSRIIEALDKQVQILESITQRASILENILEGSSGEFSFPEIISRLNAVQNLLDRIEVELDNLEMRVSAIEHIGFRIRTGVL
ncbi:MAG: hypothetical protein ACFFCP_09190 [Promethearchaeota archaeon]